MLLPNYKDILGSCMDDEAQILYDCATDAPLNRFMEIGTFIGKSASVLGQVAKERNGTLVCIDMFVENQKFWGDPKVIIPSTRDAFLMNMDRLGLMTSIMALKGNSGAILPTLNGKFGLIYIDAGHEVKSVLIDSIWAWGHLVDNSYLIFHDANNPNWDDVRIVIEVLEKKWGVERFKESSTKNMVVFKKCGL